MRLSFHGGMCCGIKHIYEMGQKPTEMCYAQEASGKAFHDVSYDFCSQDKSVYPDACPAETKLARLERYLGWLTLNRPSGIVEVTLICSGEGYYDQSLWVPVLIEKGFVRVTPDDGVYNSNSGNRVHVFHLYMKEGDHDPADDMDDCEDCGCYLEDCEC